MVYSSIKELFFPSFCLQCQEPSDLLCSSCRSHLELLKEQPDYEAAFEYIGPAAALTHAFHTQPGLDSLLASFMVLKWEKLGWQLPDLIISLPIPWHQALKTGFNPGKLLAKRLSKLFGIEHASPLKNAGNRFSWKKPLDLTYKRVVVVDDLILSRQRMQSAVACLKEGYPLKIDKMAFAMSLSDQDTAACK